MIKESAIKISYYSEKEYDNSFDFFQGLSEFKQTLEKNYSSVIKRRSDYEGKKDNELAIEILIDKTLNEALEFSSTESITKISHLIQPFIRAYRSFKMANRKVDIEELIICFNDCTLILYKVSNNSIYNQLENILDSISENFKTLKYKHTEVPFEIYIPIYNEKPIEEEDTGKLDTLLNTFNISNRVKEDEYYKYWGLFYESTTDSLVFDFEAKDLKVGIISAY